MSPIFVHASEIKNRLLLLDQTLTAQITGTLEAIPGELIYVAVLNKFRRRGCGVPPQKGFHPFTPFGSQIGLLYRLSSTEMGRDKCIECYRAL